MSILALGLNFFGLSSDYRQYMLDEYFVLSKNNYISYNDFYYNIPTYARKYLINKIIELTEQSDKN
jgi:hypothetical protein